MNRYEIYLLFAEGTGAPNSGKRVRSGEASSKEYALGMAYEIMGEEDNGVRAVEVIYSPTNVMILRIERDLSIKSPRPA